jgi:hypothetical protein
VAGATANTRHPITNGAVWNSADVGASETWTYILDDSTRTAIIDAATTMRESGVTLATATRDHLDKAAIRQLITAWREELQYGRGEFGELAVPPDQPTRAAGSRRGTFRPAEALHGLRGGGGHARSSHAGHRC